MTDTTFSPGLEGVIAAETTLSHVDGEAGELIIAGDSVETLARTTTFEALCAKLWHVDAVSLGEARVKAWSLRGGLGDALSAREGMDALRAALAHLPAGADATLVTAATAVYACAWSRRSQGLDPLPPDASITHAGDVLRMLGLEPSEARTRGLNTYLVTVSDHGMNASTFTARVIASTQSDLVSAVVGAVGALKGPLHGGAPGPVLDMLDAVGRPERAEGWLERELGAGRRVMGMGHRIYRVRDPRAAVLEQAVERLERDGSVTSARLPLARAVERVATRVLAARYPDRSLQANVEFYTAVLLDALGLDRRFFTPAFAIGRVAGWCAHVAEQKASGRLIRPGSRYVGPVPVGVQSQN